MKKVWIFVLIFVACATFLLTLNPASAATPKQEEGGPTSTRTPTVTAIPLIVGVGQSNMAGRAVAGSVATVPVGAVMMLWNPTATPGNYYWTDMKEPSSVWNGIRTPTQPATLVHGAVPYDHSPASAFVTRLMTAKGWDKIAFINCAVGGSPVSSWAPSYASATDAENFNECWQRITSAQSSNHYKVVAIVVINGESEANETIGPSEYANDMNKLYLAFNVRLQTLTPSPNRTAIPMAFLLLPNATPMGGDAKPKLYWAAVRATQIKLPTDYPGKNWDSADSDGVSRDANYHFHYYIDADTIGIRLADVLLLLPALPPSTPSKTPTPTVTLTPTRTPTLTPTP